MGIAHAILSARACFLIAAFLSASVSGGAYSRRARAWRRRSTAHESRALVRIKSAFVKPQPRP